MRVRNCCIKIAVVVVAAAAVVLAGGVSEKQLANLLISHVGQQEAAELMKMPRVSEAPFLIITPNLRYAAVCDYYAGGDSIKVEVVFDYRGENK